MTARRTTIVQCIFIGLIINVAVAWACSQWSHFTRVSFATSFQHPDHMIDHAPAMIWPTSVPESWPAHPLISVVDRGWGVARTMARAETAEQGGTAYAVREVQAGWPAPAMHGADGGQHANRSLVSPFSRGQVPGPRLGRPLPLLPMWLGTAVNTLMYTLLVLPPVMGAGALRRRLRLRRGRCPECTYPLGRSTACTECGCPLPDRGHGEPPPVAGEDGKDDVQVDASPSSNL